MEPLLHTKNTILCVHTNRKLTKSLYRANYYNALHVLNRYVRKDLELPLYRSGFPRGLTQRREYRLVSATHISTACELGTSFSSHFTLKESCVALYRMLIASTWRLGTFIDITRFSTITKLKPKAFRFHVDRNACYGRRQRHSVPATFQRINAF